MSKSISLLLVSFFLFCLSCSKEEDPIPAEFQKFVDSFVVEAKKRGKSYDMKRLKITFADLNANVAGQAILGSYSVQIDRKAWKELEDLGLENKKEEIIYHELGHAVLIREHKKEVLPDGSSASMMCGENIVADTYCGVPFGGIRKKYYIDELFNPTTPTPDWADFNNFKDAYLGSTRQLIVSEEFNDFKNFESTKPANATISNGVMSFDVGNTGIPSISFQSFLQYFTNPEKNIEIEVRFSSQNGGISLNWTPVINGEKGGFLITVNNQQSTELRLFLNPAIYGTAINKSVDDSFLKNDFNILKLRRIDNNVYFFLNNKIIYISDLLAGNPPFITSDNRNFYWFFHLGIFAGNCQLDYVRINRIIL